VVTTGVAERVPERIGSLVYLDAFVPNDGQCLLDLIPPDRRLAMEALVETEGFGWLLSRLTGAPWDRYATIAEQTPGWRLRHLDSSHLPYITHAGELAQLLDELVEAAPITPIRPNKQNTTARRPSH
jgi:hypothetical protein